MRRIYLYFICLIIGICSAAAQSKIEVRAVWLTTNYGLDWPRHIANSESSRQRQQQDLCTILDSLKAAHFNVVLLQVRSRGDVIYPSLYEPASRTFSGTYGESPGYDPLAFAIEECHKRGMECHAWLVTFPIGGTNVAKAQGKMSVVKQHPELVKNYKGTWFLDPGIPGTADYLLSIVKEIVNNYDIDGIHFDYIRYPNNSYQFPDRPEYKRYGGAFDNIEDWRRENINRIVTKLYDWVKQAKPWVVFSSCPVGKSAQIAEVPDAKFTGYEMVYQDAREWMKRGKQDMLFPMMYYQNDNFYPFVHDWVNHSGGRSIVAGLGAYRMEDESDWEVEDVTQQIDYVRAHGMQGCAFFRCANVVHNSKGLFNVLKRDYFRYPSVMPPLVWLDRYVPKQPEGLDVRRENDRLVVTWNDRDTTQHRSYTLYYSLSDSICPDSAASILATGITERRYVLPIEKNVDQGYLFRVSSSTRYHNESPLSREVYYYCTNYKK